jgi:hypothetical protein
MAQNFFDYGGVVDEADDLQRPGATRANERVGLVNLLDQPRPGAPEAARELIGATDDRSN